MTSSGRFELPKTPTALKGLQNATVSGPTCPQQQLTPGVPYGIQNYTLISEACALGFCSFM